MKTRILVCLTLLLLSRDAMSQELKCKGFIVGHDSEILDVAISPDRKWIAATAKQSSVILVIDAETGFVQKALQGKKAFYGQTVAFTADGKYLLTGINNDVVVWSVGSFQELDSWTRSPLTNPRFKRYIANDIVSA